MSEFGKIDVSQLFERLVVAEQKAAAAHSRIDKVEHQVRDDLSEIKTVLEKLTDSVQSKFTEIFALINRTRGWFAAMATVGGLVTAILIKVLH